MKLCHYFSLLLLWTVVKTEEDCGADNLEIAPYGCCQNNATYPAHGLDDLGCCANTEFGCCADDLQTALGPYGEGCSCEQTSYGCCPDGQSPAQGPNHEGCGCHFSSYGCCPDSMTEAQGANFTGCPCITFPYGCCPDGITVAEGGNLEGCLSNCSSQFGCCSDGITPKMTDLADDCPCEAKRFGCCLNGVDAAHGPLFEGCDYVPESKCHLPPERGPCTNYTDKWYFDTEYGGCSRFWYGGCQPGDNHFEDESSCQDECVISKGPKACFLQKNAGSCQGAYNEWYFDLSNRICTPFVYGGCLGNANRFLSKSDCEDLCTAQESVELCGKAKMVGSCDGSFPYWYFERELGSCLPFNYSGCNGNNNRFLTEESCLNACGHITKQRKTEQICILPIEEGNCTDLLPRWAYHSRLRRCVPFYYSGCEGNDNLFQSKEECQNICPTTFAPTIRLPRGREILAERGSNATLHIAVKANPPATVEWFHRGQPISKYNNRYTLTDNYLLIRKITDFDSGTYVIKAINDINIPDEKKIDLIVYPLAPTLAIKAEKTLFEIGDEVLLPCEIVAYPMPKVNWYKITYQQGKRSELPMHDNDLEGRIVIETYSVGTVGITSHLIIHNMTTTDGGAYKCEAVSEHAPAVYDIEGIGVQFGDTKCIDLPSFKHCDKIVEHKYCGNKYYAQYCCLSCSKAGFLPGGYL